MKIELKSLTLTNFKGIKQLQVNFDHETSIAGQNATGKTTIFDAFLWCMFGKDSTDRKEFGVKTKDKDGKIIPMIEHEVIAQLSIWDGDSNDIPRSVILKRTLREKWVKPRGQAQAEFAGNETVYTVDAVPCSQKEYMDKVDSICKENLFKLLTNPAYFPALNWSIQRQSLFSLIPEVTSGQIMDAIPAKLKKQGRFDYLLDILNAHKNLEDERKKLAAEKRKLNEELSLIPARIDEVNRATPQAEDWPILEQAIKDAEAFILRKEEEKSNKLASVQAETKKRSDLQAQINTAKQQMTAIKNETEDSIRVTMREAQQKQTEHDRYLSDYNDLIQKTENALKGYRLDMESLQAQRTTLLGEWQGISKEQYTHVVPGVCETCGQTLPEDFIQKTDEENRSKWNEGRQTRIDLNKRKGLNCAEAIKQKQTQIDETTAKIEKLKSDLDAVRKGWEGDETPSEIMGMSGVSPAALSFVAQVDAALKEHEEYQKLVKDGGALVIKLEKLGPIKAVDTSDIEKEISFARTSLDENKVKLGKKELIARADQRKSELEVSQTTLSQKIADLEQMEFTIETFIRTKVDLLEAQINKLFKFVKFKMFNLQINGQLEETCEASIDGVPYSDLNNAARINAGIDIINTMSTAYGIIAPIWIDNRESVNEIIETRAQLVSLYVTLDKELIIT
jgi:DNA repair exonuclease SbcCD ATPase subunit